MKRAYSRLANRRIRISTVLIIHFTTLGDVSSLCRCPVCTGWRQAREEELLQRILHIERAAVLLCLCSYQPSECVRNKRHFCIILKHHFTGAYLVKLPSHIIAMVAWSLYTGQALRWKYSLFLQVSRPQISGKLFHS